MLCPHTESKELQPPSISDPVYREECTQCFDSIDDAAGIDVCLHCFNGGCCSDRQHALLHSKSRQHPLTLNIRRTRKAKHQDGPPKIISKLAIAAETETDRYDIATRVKCYSCEQEDASPPEGNLQRVTDGVLKAETFSRREEVKAWEQEITTCEHILCLQQGQARSIDSQEPGHCFACDIKDNLWLCLTCGNLGCGRELYGGVGGNSHALSHTDQTSHPVAVKLGSLTAHGSADVYCYVCDEERADPELAKHLQQWGINIADRQKTEMSLTEMQIEQNLRWEFSMTSADGKELKPVFGAGFTGLKNLGNSCYLASVIQALYSLPEFSNRYHLPSESQPDVQKPAEDLETQLRKMGDGLFSGRYSKPNDEVQASESVNELAYQKGLQPAMLKSLVGRDHPEFSTMRQQDAFEFLLHLMKLINRSALSSNTFNPTDAFKFEMEQRLQCTNCRKVRYKTDEQDNISVAVPIRRKSKLAPSLGGAIQNSDKTEEFEEVALKECLDTFTSPEAVELTCNGCGSRAGFTKQTSFKTFPSVLAINARRFELVNWLPTKQDVPVVVDDQVISFDRYLSKGRQDSEEALPDDEKPSKASFVPNANALSLLQAMGFPAVRCERALLATGNEDAEAASNWLFSHMDDPQVDEPLTENEKSLASGEEVDAGKLEGLQSMGFSDAQARQALKETNGDMERAVDWLFSHPEATGVTVSNAAEQSESNDTSTKPQHGNSILPANYKLQSIICHKGSSIHAGHYVAFIRKTPPTEDEESWIFFNDEKVAKAVDAEEMKRFAYIYIFRRV